MVDLFERDLKNIAKTTDLKTYGIILYNEENPHIVQLLRDSDYWEGLSTASGEKFFVFAIKPKEGSYKFPNLNNTLGFMVPIWEEPEINQKLLESFEIKSTEKLPLFFIFTKVDHFLLKQQISITSKTKEEAYTELRDIFIKIRKEVSNLNKEYDEHDAQIHDKLAFILTKSKFKKVTKKAFDVLSGIGLIEFIGSKIF
ncbi:MAG: hypothetical protein PHR87_03595 [Sulfurospirillaceae bacterium]|nr:hypothetical protein [Sulfurospirillaceae bacterium]